jgi:hypothetical protein
VVNLSLKDGLTRVELVDEEENNEVELDNSLARLE